MISQPSLLDWVPPAQQHSRPSLQAADAIKPRAPELRQKVLEFIASRPDGATDEECQLGMPMPQNTQRPRRVELVEAGLIVDSGMTRKTRSGRAATVWKVAP